LLSSSNIIVYLFTAYYVFYRINPTDVYVGCVATGSFADNLTHPSSAQLLRSCFSFFAPASVLINMCGGTDNGREYPLNSYLKVHVRDESQVEVWVLGDGVVARAKETEEVKDKIEQMKSKIWVGK
jgi:hypothetical protein